MKSMKSYTPMSDEVFLKRSQSTASRKTQTSLDMIEKDVERIKAQIKTGDDIDAQEVLQAVLLMLDDMRYNMKLLKVFYLMPGSLQILLTSFLVFWSLWLRDFLYFKFLFCLSCLAK